MCGTRNQTLADGEQGSADRDEGKAPLTSGRTGGDAGIRGPQKTRADLVACDVRTARWVWTGRGRAPPAGEVRLFAAPGGGPAADWRPPPHGGLRACGLRGKQCREYKI